MREEEATTFTAGEFVLHSNIIQMLLPPLNLWCTLPKSSGAL